EYVAVAEQNHWSECGRATPVNSSDALGRPHRSVRSFAGERRQRNAPANVADEPRAGPQRGGVSPPNSSGTPDKGPLDGAAERIGSRRFANGRAVHRQTRRMEPPGCTRSEQSDVCESGGSSAAFGG